MRIPAKFAEIHWSEQRPFGSREFLVDEVEVFDRRLPRRDRRDLDNSLGACCADWCDGTDARSTPEGVFVNWMRDGFVDDEARIAALRELGKIEGCDWAITMADAFNRWLPAEAF